MSLDLENAENRFRLEPATDETPEKVFDRRWALTLLDRVLATLQAEMIRTNRGMQFDRLKHHLLGDQAELSYAETAAALGMSEGAIKVAVHRLRKRYRDLIREEISQTVSSPDEIEDELKHLRSSVGR